MIRGGAVLVLERLRRCSSWSISCCRSQKRSEIQEQKVGQLIKEACSCFTSSTTRDLQDAQQHDVVDIWLN